jgi:hypothetical protein
MSAKFPDGRLAEIFIDAGKPDSEIAVHMNDAAVLASLLLQHGVTAAAIRHSISGPLGAGVFQSAAIGQPQSTPPWKFH